MHLLLATPAGSPLLPTHRIARSVRSRQEQQETVWPLVPYVTKEQEPASSPFQAASLTVLETRGRRSLVHQRMEEMQEGMLSGLKRKRKEEEEEEVKGLFKRARLQGSV